MYGQNNNMMGMNPMMNQYGYGGMPSPRMSPRNMYNDSPMGNYSPGYQVGRRVRE